ncbi:hypothetical protein, partial [Novosphingobium marinum]|uniref:hypothetical protein n=1 Tax=Novosphingobium marinum TaxID=1514948 RepID=UPI001E477A51
DTSTLTTARMTTRSLLLRILSHHHSVAGAAYLDKAACTPRLRTSIVFGGAFQFQNPLEIVANCVSQHTV